MNKPCCVTLGQKTELYDMDKGIEMNYNASTSNDHDKCGQQESGTRGFHRGNPKVHFHCELP